MTLGSLFDGIGGFPLSGFDFGIEPVWASEIEPFPIRVTQIRFPNMQHVGDITKLNGAELEPVDIITGGSPCQDLSVAGKRAGLEGARSGLFMEQIRIIKEARAKFGKPRFMVWENVPGAFSSAGGEDFRAVIEETARIAENGVSIPRPSDGGWAGAGCIMADTWSIAWRTLDAQFWGVPQRRRRIFLVADFGGQSAPEILFKPESVSGDTAESRTQGEGTAEGAERGAGKTKCYDIGEARLRTPQEYIEKTPSITSRCGTGENNVPAVVKTLQMREDKAGGGKGPLIQTDQSATLGTGNGQTVFAFDRAAFHQGINAKYGIEINADGISPTCVASGPNGVCAGTYRMQAFGDYEGTDSASAIKRRDYKDATDLISTPLAVRRLTPLECERLQGFPDGWTDIPKATDSARYKALGNSVAIPCVKFVLQGIAEEIRRAAHDGRRGGYAD